VDRVVLRPLRDAMTAAEAIADGDLERRLAEGESLEMSNLALSINRMTNRLLEDRAHLVRAEKLASVGRLAAGIAHEIGNPLGAINGYVHLLRSAPAGSSRAVEALDGLDREAARIDRIIRGLLDYARPRPRVAGDVDLNEVVTAVVDLLTGQGVLRNIDVRMKVPQQSLAILGERHDVEQALVNLVLNAVDAMNGSGALEVVMRRTTREELLGGAHRSSDPTSRAPTLPSAQVARWLDQSGAEDVVTVTIADSGPGIPASDVERIFEPFFTTKEPGKGTGLGLAIAARAIENSGGMIWASRSREGGAAFRILFPLNPTTPQGAPAAASLQPPASSLQPRVS
jgi:hypothetical protein